MKNEQTSISAIIGTGNPEGGDYVTAIHTAPRVEFTSIRKEARKARVRRQYIEGKVLSDADLERFVVEMKRNGHPEAGSLRAIILEAYQDELKARRSSGVDLGIGATFHAHF